MEIMAKKMLIDATHAEETRVVVVEGNKVEEFDFESENRRQLAGNIYLAKVTRIEPSLQAAFIDYGGNRHGFLAFSEIHPDYYQIPVADREALMEEERAFSEALRRKDDEEESDELLANESQNKKEVTEDLEILQSPVSKDAKVDEESDFFADEKATSKDKSKRSLTKKRQSSKKKETGKNLETEETAVSEEKTIKKPRGRPKKSSKPIAANIETDANDLVVKSDDAGALEQENSETQATDGSETGVKRRRYRKRSRRSNNDITSDKDKLEIELKEKDDSSEDLNFLDFEDNQNDNLESNNENILDSQIISEKDSVLQLDGDETDSKKAIHDKQIKSDFEMPET